MFWISIKKELGYFFKNKGNIVFVFFLPFLFILVMSTALKDYMATDYETFDDGVVLYYLENPTAEAIGYLQEFRELIKESTQVEMEEVNNYDEGKRKVEQSDAFGIIKVSENEFSYYRSPFNEPEGGKVVRGIFEMSIGKNISLQDEEISTQIIEKPRVNANGYYTFAGLAFIMMYISLMTGNSVIDERRFGTIERIKLSGLGLNMLLISKALLGICIGILQIVTVYILSNVFLDVDWGNMTALMFLVLIGIAVVFSVFGVVIGITAANKTISSNIILMSVMLFAWVGGSFSPVSLLENMSIVKHIIKLSPTYWVGRSLNNLNLGICDKYTFICLAVQLGITVFLYFVYKRLSKNNKLVIQGG